MGKYNSQFRQDEFLNEEVIKGYQGGFFVDVGAYNGVTFSNTLYFERENNWSGICIEPIPRAFDCLKRNRNCVCVNCAIFEEEGEYDFLWLDDYNRGDMLSGLKTEFDIRHLNHLNIFAQKYNRQSKTIKVKARKLKSILDEYGVKQIDLLSIDTENSEISVLKSIDYSKVFIECMVIENLFDTNDYENYLKDFGFTKIIKIYKDDFFLHEKSKFMKNLNPAAFDKYKYPNNL